MWFKDLVNIAQSLSFRNKIVLVIESVRDLAIYSKYPKHKQRALKLCLVEWTHKESGNLAAQTAFHHGQMGF